MSSPAETPAFGSIIDVRRLFGPLLIGVFFNMILFGLLIAQTMTYFQTARKDPIWMRLLVSFYVLFVETANTALDISVMYQPLVLQYGSIPGPLPTVFLTRKNSLECLKSASHHPLDVEPLCIALVAFPIELFFIWRIRTLTGGIILPAIFFVFALLAFGAGIWTTIALGGAGRWDNVSVSFQAAKVWISSSMGTDLCIAFTLAWALRSKKTGFGGTDTVVNRIVRMTVQTGLITAVVNVLDMLSFLFIKNSTFNFMWSNPLSKLYSNCMMSTLNARTNLKQSLPTHVSDTADRSAGSRGFVAARLVTLDNKDTIGGSTYHTQSVTNDLSDPEYGIRMNKIVERF
ncbi:hypothetical protein C8F04DRAFT_1323994 [Mycena alexandri]|uniref:DUF6534 domain-containing protein n=1 Tax=Mycena alexandri TaxID=1745969 RepID=A0AAD6WSF1_9AGAR|nr:hypothetical protein C8F04DRAFT_1323994 [Mycena alexandri]